LRLYEHSALGRLAIGLQGNAADIAFSSSMVDDPKSGQQLNAQGNHETALP